MSDNMDMPDEDLTACDHRYATATSVVCLDCGTYRAPGISETSPRDLDNVKASVSSYIDPSTVLTIGSRDWKNVVIFGRPYRLRRPDEGTPADTSRARTLGQRLSTLASRKNPTDADMQGMADSSRELMTILLPEIDPSTVKFLTMSEMAKISEAWGAAYGQNRETPE